MKASSESGLCAILISRVAEAAIVSAGVEVEELKAGTFRKVRHSHCPINACG